MVYFFRIGSFSNFGKCRLSDTELYGEYGWWRLNGQDFELWWRIICPESWFSAKFGSKQRIWKYWTKPNDEWDPSTRYLMICILFCCFFILNDMCIWMSSLFSSGSPQAFSMLGSSYPAAGGPSQNHVQAMNSLSSMSFLNEMNSSNDVSSFDINNDFPQLISRSTSAQGQLGK